jgi:hypothetical protein
MNFPLRASTQRGSMTARRHRRAGVISLAAWFWRLSCSSRAPTVRKEFVMKRGEAPEPNDTRPGIQSDDLRPELRLLRWIEEAQVEERFRRSVARFN